MRGFFAKPTQEADRYSGWTLEEIVAEDSRARDEGDLVAQMHLDRWCRNELARWQKFAESGGQA